MIELANVMYVKVSMSIILTYLLLSGGLYGTRGLFK